MVTMAENETAAVEQFIVNDELGPQSLHGRLLAKCVWDYEDAYERGQVRWTDLLLYRNAETASPNQYVLQTVARSVVYHLLGGRCRRGRKAPVGLLRHDEARYEALAACTVCCPPDLNELADSYAVSVEQDFPYLDLCSNATELLALLQKSKSTALNAKLIQQAVLRDADIATALKGRRL